MDEKIDETNVRREAVIKEIAEFLRKVLPKHTLHQQTPPLDSECCEN